MEKVKILNLLIICIQKITCLTKIALEISQNGLKIQSKTD
jgi:hypothetical protein